jgi:hypothetical protein
MSFVRWLLYKGPGTFGLGFLYLAACNKSGKLFWIGACLIVIETTINIIHNKRNKSK